eukprot:1263638-Amphidinium_carterae.1
MPTRLCAWRLRTYVMFSTILAALLLICQTSIFYSVSPAEQLWMADPPSLPDMVRFHQVASDDKSQVQGGRLGRCAVVGSGNAMLGSGYGEEVDAHDTVVRVNRLPTESFFGDFGQRTSILFGGKYLERQSEACIPAAT